MTSTPSIAHAPARSPRAYHPTRAEQETVIRWDREDSTVHVWSANPAVWRKMARLGLAVVKESHWPDGAVAGRWYRAPLGHFRWAIRPKRAGTGTGNPAALQKARLARERLGTRRETPALTAGAGR